MNHYWLILLIVTLIFPQIDPEIGLRPRPSTWVAFINATIHINHEETIIDGSLVIGEGKIQSIGHGISIPKYAKIIDCSDKHIYPGFIDMYTPIRVELNDKKLNAHWNNRIHPELVPDVDSASFNKLSQMKNLGFTLASVSSDKGIFRGKNQIFSLGELTPKSIIGGKEIQHLAFEHGSWHDNQYPNSLLGTIALLRQTFLDVKWYQEALKKYTKYPQLNSRPNLNIALQELSDYKGFFLFDAGASEPSIERILKLQKEFDLEVALVGSGYEYRNLHLLKKEKPFFIVPLDFSQVPFVNTTSAALEVNLKTLKHWDQGPFNPYKLLENGNEIAITSFGLDVKSFRKNLIKAIDYGLSKKDALAALTTVPAKKLDLDDKLGSLNEGKLAHFFIMDGDYFDIESNMLTVWIENQEYIINHRPAIDIRGTWQPINNNFLDSLMFIEKIFSPSGNAFKDTTTIKLDKINYLYPQLDFNYAIKDKSVFRFSGHVKEHQISGILTSPKGENLIISFEKIANFNNNSKKDKKIDEISWIEPLFPEGQYGFENKPKKQEIIFRNATIWTSSKDGILVNSDIFVKNGKIVKIGKDLKKIKGVKEFDITGKHITAGLVDAHSHTALSAINEGSQAITSEVRIKDVINPYDIAIYRELAGGLTAANQLHGSANPIGGQNAIIKLRWGSTAEEMIIKDASPGIKFALGENVKQSNWGDDYTSRYPQTRMGVDQFIRDSFNAAKEYEKKWEIYNNSNKKKLIKPRRDLELEALLEILNGERDIHCHSYRQDEILNLIRIADDFEFTIGTFQHVLEGYKVAEAIKEHGAYASTFSDWWAYKFEVYDAIPYNGAIMHEAGVLVSFNSDSNELARRMNLEGAKGMKYGNMSLEDALDLVTINPAIQLGIDHRTGSLETGKDADFVIWSGNPLSTYTICEQTWIDGRKYFDIDIDADMVKRDSQLRTFLIQKALKNYEKPSKQKRKKKKEYHFQKHSCGTELIQ